VVAIMAGLLPIMWSTGTGSEIMQRIAVPMIGGMISSTLLTLIVIPAIFGLVKGFRLPNKDPFDSQPPWPDQSQSHGLNVFRSQPNEVNHDGWNDDRNDGAHGSDLAAGHYRPDPLRSGAHQVFVV
jgi:hypothetical protein